MSRIGSKETNPERLVRSSLHCLKYRFRKNVKDLPGCPDIVLPKYRIVIFVNGCFWHRHDCYVGQKIPKNNYEYWNKKLQRNELRDIENKKKLINLGWRVSVVWECELKSIDSAIYRLDEEIKSQYSSRKG